MGQTDSVQAQTVAIVEPAPNKEEEDAEGEFIGQELEEVVIMGGGEQAAPLAQEEENLSTFDEDFATPEAVSPVNPKPVEGPSPIDKTITPLVNQTNGIQRCESPDETSYEK